MTANQYYRMLIRSRSSFWCVHLDETTPSPLRIGPSADCDIKLSGVADQVELAFYFNNGEWHYASAEQVRAFRTDQGQPAPCSDVIIQNGLRLSLCIPVGGKLEEQLSVSAEDRYAIRGIRYDFCVNPDTASAMDIGGTSGCHIQINTPVTADMRVHLSRTGSDWRVEKKSGRAQVYLNETQLNGTGLLRNNDFLTMGDIRIFYQNQSFYMPSEIQPVCRDMQSHVIMESTSALQYPIFVRSTRIQHQVKTDEIVIQMPKQPQKPDRENFVLKVLPAATMLVAMLAMRGMMGGASAAGMLLYTGASMGASLLVMVLSRKESKKYAALDETERRKRYYDYIERKIQEITLRRQDEMRILDRIYRSSDDNIHIVQNFENGLFDRAPDDIDFLDVRLGTGRRPAAITVKAEIPEYQDADDDLQDKAQEVVDKYSHLEDAPIVARLNDTNAIGIVGKRRWLYEMLKTMTTDLTIRQYYKELKIYYVIGEEDQQQFAWTRWLRNCFDSESNTFRNILCDPESNKFHLEVLYRILSDREASLTENKAVLWPEYFIIFVYRVDIVRNHPVSQYFERCAALGVRFIFMDENAERIPRGCSQLIRLDKKASEGSLLFTMDGGNVNPFTYPMIMEDRMQEIVRKLCKVHVVESNLANEMVKSITLYDMLHIKRATDLPLRENWHKSNIVKSMSVPLGVRAKNAVVSLDLHEKAHGPHGLVAGTTGSGKSEILQTYIINMCIFFHPYEVTFLLIDFKGGGMANQFRGMPHLAGSITDIDGREIERSLKSIKAELERRKRLFAEVNVNKIDDYIKIYKAKPENVPAPLPHLIIVVDEFAELKAEQPEFMKELISTARIGRSLGVHLILATQKPSGVVDGQIWSNSRFKLCLKVQTKEDSQDMIKTPLAAEIREPGRAYLQVGNNELFELFQSAYSGGSVPNIDPGTKNPYKIHELNMWGKPTLIYEQKASGDKEDGTKPDTQLDALVKYVTSYCKESGIDPLPSIVLQPLVQVVALDELKPIAGNGKDIVVTVAMYDDPENQYQGSYSINLTTGNTFAIGASQMGKTNLLQTIMYDAIRRYGSDEVNFYVIDCGTLAMHVFEDSCYVGGVVGVNDEDRIKNLLRLLERTIAERRNLFMQKNVGTYDAYLDLNEGKLPLIVLVIDNIAGFREYYEQYDDTIQMLSREGLSVGISMIVTGSASGNLTYRMSSNFVNKICLTCNDETEYSNLMNVRNMQPYNYPGRALVPLEKRVVEAQFALTHRAESEKDRMAMLQEALEERNRSAVSQAAQIPFVPKELTLQDQMRKNPALFHVPYRIILGMEYETVEYISIALDQTASLIVNGRAGGSKYAAVRAIVNQLQNNILAAPVEAVVMDGRRKHLASLRDISFVRDYITDTAAMRLAISELHEEMEERQRQLYEIEDADERNDLLTKWPLKLLIISDDQAIKLASEDKEIYPMMYDIIAQFEGCKCCILWVDYPNAKATMLSGNDLTRHIGTIGTYLYFDYLSNLKMSELTLQMTRALRRPYVAGDAYWHYEEELKHIRVLTDQE